MRPAGKVSLKPRIFVIENLISEWECDHIVELGKQAKHTFSLTHLFSVTLCDLIGLSMCGDSRHVMRCRW